jgi:hypothetical protein
MTRGHNQHVVLRDGGWAVKRGREVSRNQHLELFVHRRDGRIRERDSHGHAPKSPKG